MDDKNTHADRVQPRELTAASITTDGPVWRLTPTVDAPATARQAIAATIPDFARIDDLLLVTSEAVTNAVCHGSRPEDTIDVRLRYASGIAHVEVVQRGRTFAVDQAIEPTQGGRGLKIIEALVDEWGVHQGPKTATVWFRMS